MGKSTDLISVLKDKNQDMEFYPTTDKMVDCINANMLSCFDTDSTINILDCGAGDGRVLEGLNSNSGNLYAIEKSTVLLKELDSSILVIGTDFEMSTLIDKQVDVLFCNPPYSVYESWAVKIIREANTAMIYLIIPKRWETSPVIADAIKQREARVSVLGEFDFLDAERKARAKVNILAIKLYGGNGYMRKRINVDPFSLWFDEYFSFADEGVAFSEDEGAFKLRIENALISNNDTISVFVGFYEEEMGLLCQNYKDVSKLNPVILKELGVNVSALKESLKQKIAGLKFRYWREFLSKYKKITDRLTIFSRKTIMDKLMGNTAIDFTESNIYAVTIWTIKNANKYYDSQLVRLVEEIVSRSNIKLYKSNKRVWENNEWCYSRKPEDLNRYSLELRIIISNKGGIYSGDEYGHTMYYTNNLYNGAHEFLSDIVTIANNLGFTCSDDSKGFQWESGKKITFTSLMEVKAFKNRNLHIKFNKKFILKLNVEFGRLEGWLNSPKAASEDLCVHIEDVNALFGSNYQLKSFDVPLITQGT